MSTKKILSKNAGREASMRRTQAITELRRLAYTFAEGSTGRFRIDSLCAALEQVRRDPRFTCEQKDAKFKSLLNRAR